jgi:hypothetical protein
MKSSHSADPVVAILVVTILDVTILDVAITLLMPFQFTPMTHRVLVSNRSAPGA